MSKKRKQAQQKQLSPEKYIQTQARNLSIHECLINTDWKENRICNILITRKHNNGNFTSGVYLVDLYCLGVKEAECTFNQSPIEYNEFKEEYFPEDFFEKTDYTLVHNIIHAGLEFASDYGFQPCKEFNQRAKYILEEDTEDIELMEIECGKDNKPFIMVGDENREEAKRAFNHLQNTVGPDGFIYSEVKSMNNHSVDSEYDDMDEDYDDDDYEEEDIPVEEYIYEKPLAERIEDIKRFKELEDVEKHTDPDEAIELLYVAKRLIYNYYGLDKIEASREKFLKFMDIEIDIDSIPRSLCVTQSEEHIEKIEDLITAFDFDEDLKKFKLKKLANDYPEVPFYSYMHIIDMTLKEESNKKIEKQIDEYLSIYPNYLLLKLEYDKHLCLNDKEALFINEKLINESSISKLSDNRKSIHSLEFMAFHSALFAFLVSKKDVLALDSFIYATKILFPEMEEAFSEKEVFSELLKVEFCKKHYGN